MTFLHFLILSSIVFIIGLVGLMMNRRHLIRALLALEVLFLSVHLLFVSSSAFLGDLQGQVMSLFVLGVGAAEVAVGLSLLVLFYRRYQRTDVDDIAQLKG